MTTALQELIEWAKTKAVHGEDNKSIMTKMNELLEVEKQYLEYAFDAGSDYRLYSDLDEPELPATNFEEWYNKKINPQTK